MFLNISIISIRSSCLRWKPSGVAKDISLLVGIYNIVFTETVLFREKKKRRNPIRVSGIYNPTNKNTLDGFFFVFFV